MQSTAGNVGFHSALNAAKGIHPFYKTNVWISVAISVGHIASIWAAAFIMHIVLHWSYIVSAFIFPFGMLVIARQLRVLELLVHDGSHYNWHRANRKLNDLLTNWLSAYPTFQNVAAYRKDHNIHHKQFGEDADPCLRRYVRLGMTHLSEMSKYQVTKQMIKMFPSYVVGYYSQIGTNSGALIPGIFWHIIMVITPISISSGSVTFAFIVWVIYFGVPFVFVLSPLRMIAESEEHLYDKDTEFGATVNNVGFWHTLIIHPNGDEYHLIHHLYPAVPTWRQKYLHIKLKKTDKYYAERGGERHEILGSTCAS